MFTSSSRLRARMRKPPCFTSCSPAESGGRTIGRLRLARTDEADWRISSRAGRRITSPWLSPGPHRRRSIARRRHQVRHPVLVDAMGAETRGIVRWPSIRIPSAPPGSPRRIGGILLRLGTGTVCKSPSLLNCAVLRVVGFVFFRRQLLKIGWAHLFVIFVEDPDVRRKLRTRKRYRLESQRGAVVSLHSPLNALSGVNEVPHTALDIGSTRHFHGRRPSTLSRGGVVRLALVSAPKRRAPVHVGMTGIRSTAIARGGNSGSLKVGKQAYMVRAVKTGLRAPLPAVFSRRHSCQQRPRPSGRNPSSSQLETPSRFEVPEARRPAAFQRS
jgi:hypothetical protein